MNKDEHGALLITGKVFRGVEPKCLPGRCDYIKALSRHRTIKAVAGDVGVPMGKQAHNARGNSEMSQNTVQRLAFLLNKRERVGAHMCPSTKTFWKDTQQNVHNDFLWGIECKSF